MSEIQSLTRVKILQHCDTPKHWYEILNFTNKASSTLSVTMRNLQDVGYLQKGELRYTTTKKGKTWYKAVIRVVQKELQEIQNYRNVSESKN